MVNDRVSLIKSKLAFVLSIFCIFFNNFYFSDEKLCMWRRDGASLLQKYMVVTAESQGNDIIFKASSVYSCWEEKRKNDFFQIKVQLVGDKKEGKVKVVDIPEFEKYSVEDRPKVISIFIYKKYFFKAVKLSFYFVLFRISIYSGFI